jgi:NADH:ubiquinone oxidoreductase subunit 5 (subunit L)/multisubunit Na+/H+ antiporter MnhA subunit
MSSESLLQMLRSDTAMLVIAVLVALVSILAAMYTFQYLRRSRSHDKYASMKFADVLDLWSRRMHDEYNEKRNQKREETNTR